LYRKKALEDVKENNKYFDEYFHYGLDTDMSNRLKEKGWKLIQLKNTHCLHYWKTSFKSYFRQCFNIGYARLRLMKKYKKVMIDKITTLKLSLQIPILGLFLLTLFLSLFLNFFLIPSSLILVILFGLQISRAAWVLRVKKDKTIALLFPFLMQIRNFAVIFAIIWYLFNKLRGLEK
jgi:GT2 family glycosyltransferase